MMDRSRFPSALVAPNGPVEFVHSATELADSMPGTVLLDLDRCDDVAPFLAEGRRVIGFGSHVETETLDAAARAGVDEVMARSVFFHRLVEIIERESVTARNTSEVER